MEGTSIEMRTVERKEEIKNERQEKRVRAGEVDWEAVTETKTEREQTVSEYCYWGQRSCPIKYRFSVMGPEIYMKY